jgi:hypothetical protein
MQAYHQYAWVRARLCKLQKMVHSTRSASDKAYQLLAHGRWFSPGTSASSTTKTDRHDIAEILQKVALNTNNQVNQNHPLTQLSITILRYVSCFHLVLRYPPPKWKILRHYLHYLHVINKTEEKRPISFSCKDYFDNEYGIT